jgi:hypothetical protein
MSLAVLVLALRAPKQYQPTNNVGGQSHSTRAHARPYDFVPVADTLQSRFCFATHRSLEPFNWHVDSPHALFPAGFYPQTICACTTRAFRELHCATTRVARMLS